MEKEKEKKGLKKDFKIKITEFAEIPEGELKPKMVHQETLYTYPKGFIPDDELPKPLTTKSWTELFKDDTPSNRKTLTVEEIKNKAVKEKPKPTFILNVVDEDDYLEKEIHKVYKFEVIFVNLGDDYSDDPKEEIEHFIEQGLNRWNCMNASVMISDVRQRFIDWNAEEIQDIYNMNDSTFKDWNKIFAQEEEGDLDE